MFKNPFKRNTQEERDRTTKTIALVLLNTFVFSIITLFAVNVFLDTDDTDAKKGWFDLLKNGLVLLGTALTTVIGYYFGQKEGSIKAEAAEKQAKASEEKAKATEEKAKNVVEKVITNTNKVVSDAVT